MIRTYSSRKKVQSEKVKSKPEEQKSTTQQKGRRRAGQSSKSAVARKSRAVLNPADKQKILEEQQYWAMIDQTNLKKEAITKQCLPFTPVLVPASSGQPGALLTLDQLFHTEERRDSTRLSQSFENENHSLLQPANKAPKKRQSKRLQTKKTPQKAAEKEVEKEVHQQQQQQQEQEEEEEEEERKQETQPVAEENDHHEYSIDQFVVQEEEEEEEHEEEDDEEEQEEEQESIQTPSGLERTQRASLGHQLLQNMSMATPQAVSPRHEESIHLHSLLDVSCFQETVYEEEEEEEKEEEEQEEEQETKDNSSNDEQVPASPQETSDHAQTDDDDDANEHEEQEQDDDQSKEEEEISLLNESAAPLEEGDSGQLDRSDVHVGIMTTDIVALMKNAFMTEDVVAEVDPELENCLSYADFLTEPQPSASSVADAASASTLSDEISFTKLDAEPASEPREADQSICWADLL